MKKIIATVLAMVMALALCTTAFAATYSDAYQWNNGWKKYDLNGKSIAYTSPTEVKTDGKVTRGTVGYYSVEDVDDTLVEVAKADATFQMKVDGVVKYLAHCDYTEYTAVGTSVKAGTKCGDYDKDEYGSDKLVKVGDDLYVVADGGQTHILLNGSVVPANKVENPVIVAHQWATIEGKIVLDEDDLAKLAEVKGTVVCKACNTKATVTNDKATIPTDATVMEVTEGVWMFWAKGTTAGTTTSTTASSPKTFDAGIAMYVGMALTSVAGSAVVIGKKKEF